MALRGLCTFIMHSMWQEVKFHPSAILVNLKKNAYPDLRFLSKFRQFFFLKVLISKNAIIRATGPLHLHYAFHVAGSRFLERFVRQQFWSIFEKKMHVLTLDFFRNFGNFFHKLLISKNANIRATGPLHLHYAFHVAGSRFLEHFIRQQFLSIFEKNCMSGP